MIWHNYTSVLLDVGIPQEASTMKFVSNTLVSIKKLNSANVVILSPLFVNVLKGADLVSTFFVRHAGKPKGPESQKLRLLRR